MSAWGNSIERSGLGGARRRGSAQFMVCVCVLAASGLALAVAKEKQWLRLLKLPVPMKQKFDNLQPPDPYRMSLLPRLSTEVEGELGANDYAVWDVRDASTATTAPTSAINLFLTYYTGKPDQVPHVPEECIQQAGGLQTADKTISLEMKDGRKLPVRRLMFRSSASSRGSLVYYLFSVNGDYMTTRDEVRLRMSNFTERYLYYSKVEISFSVPQADRYAVDQMDAAAARMFGWVIPQLEMNYWADVRSMEAAVRGT